MSPGVGWRQWVAPCNVALVDTVGKTSVAGSAGGLLRIPAQTGTVGSATITLDNDRLAVEHAGQFVQRRVGHWRHAEYHTPMQVHFAHHATLGEIAIDEARRRVDMPQPRHSSGWRYAPGRPVTNGRPSRTL